MVQLRTARHPGEQVLAADAGSWLPVAGFVSSLDELVAAVRTEFQNNERPAFSNPVSLGWAESAARDKFGAHCLKADRDGL